MHHVIVCTLCSCYPGGLLGNPPAWYKSFEYRSRVVREPRAVLAEFGMEVEPDVELRVHDSTAEQRYLVLPLRPAGTEGWGEEQLAAPRDTQLDDRHRPPADALDLSALGCHVLAGTAGTCDYRRWHGFRPPPRSTVGAWSGGSSASRSRWRSRSSGATGWCGSTPRSIGYLFGVVFMVFGVVYRYAVWLRRPPTAMLNRRGWDAFRERKAPQPRRPAGAGGHAPARPGVHPPALTEPLARPPARVLGLHPRRAGDVPADARPAALRERRPGGRPVPGVHLPRRHAAVRRRERRRLVLLPRPRHRGRARARPACSCSCAAACATRARWRRSAAATSSPSPGCSPCR